MPSDLWPEFEWGLREAITGRMAAAAARKLFGTAPTTETSDRRHCNPLFPGDPSMCFADAENCECLKEDEDDDRDE